MYLRLTINVGAGAWKPWVPSWVVWILYNEEQVKWYDIISVVLFSTFWRIWYSSLKFYKFNFFKPQGESDLIFFTAIISIDYSKGKCIYFSQFSIICTTWEHWQELVQNPKIILLDWDYDLISRSKKNCYEEQVHRTSGQQTNREACLYGELSCCHVNVSVWSIHSKLWSYAPSQVFHPED